jgi:hypothetical protein
MTEASVLHAGASGLTPEASRLMTEASELTMEAFVLHTDAPGATPEASKLMTEASVLHADASAKTPSERPET